MDWAALLPGLVTPENGVLVVVLTWVLIIQRGTSRDRDAHQKERDSWHTELQRVRTERDEDCARVRKENQGLEDQLDRERGRRREAEDRSPPSPLPPGDPAPRQIEPSTTAFDSPTLRIVADEATP